MEKVLPIMLLAGADKNIHDDLENIFRGKYLIMSADNEYECSNILTNSKVEVIVIALNVQIMDGIDFLKNLAQDSRYKNIPKLVIVSLGDFDSVYKAFELGAADFVTTPLNEIITTYRIRNAIAHCQQAEKDARIKEMNRYIEMDSLTGLYNREAFYEKSAALIHENPEVQYCIVYLDISCFKVVNDLFHTETGNLILKTAAAYFLKKINPSVGISGRIEADHFALCVPQDTLDMDRLMKEIDDTIHSLGISHNILFFAGVYPIIDINLPVDQMCDRASMALNKIKGNYVRRYNFYDVGMRERMLKEQMIVRDMEFALKDNQFTIFLQPIFRPETNEIVSAEALVRWFHPESGMISPGYFIPVFERNGFIVKLDRFVWETVCKFLRSRLDAGKKIVPVSVNVSRLNFDSYDLLIFLLNLLKKYDLEPYMLKLEVTESAYTDNPQQLIKIINQFKENGFPILMDDFGSGYSSLNMLKNIAIDVLKVDMAFVREIEHSERARTILLMIIGLAKELGMGVVTEGVETQTQLDYITSMGSVDIQGYYFSKPLAVKDFNALFDKYDSLNTKV